DQYYLFVILSSGQVNDDTVLSAVHFVIEETAVSLIIILGLDNRGAITAAVDAMLAAEMPKSFMRSLVERIMPQVIAALAQVVTDVNGIVREHTDQMVHRVVDPSQAVATAVAEGKAAVMAVTYSLSDGSVQIGDTLGPVEA